MTLHRSLHRSPALGQAARLLWLALVLLACNLGTSPAPPPTLAPRATATPPPPLGVDQTGAQPGSIVPQSVATPVVVSDARMLNLINQVDMNRLMVHVETLQNFHSRHVLSSVTDPNRGIGAARAYIESQFRAYQQASEGRLATYTQEFVLDWGGVKTTQQNIFAVVQGTEPGAGWVIVGAHYDSIVVPDFTNGVAFAPGANDNGTGVAAVLELARITSQTPHRSSIMFVLFSAEEVGRKGSIAFADYLVSRNIDVIAMINIDTIGNTQNTRGEINNTELRVFSAGPNDTSPDRQLARTAEFISFTEGTRLKLTVQDAIDRENRFGDHFSFTEKGYPAIRFINAFEEKINGDPKDTYEFIEPDYFQQATQALLVVITSLADGPRPPQNVALRPRGGSVQQLIWEPVPEAVGYLVALRQSDWLSYGQQIEVPGNSIEWDGFSSYAGIAIAARGKDGIIGPLSPELNPAGP
jgi:hypothetical protein